MLPSRQWAASLMLVDQWTRSWTRLQRQLTPQHLKAKQPGHQWMPMPLHQAPLSTIQRTRSSLPQPRPW